MAIPQDARLRLHGAIGTHWWLMAVFPLRKNRNQSIGAWLKRYELRSKGTGRRPSVGDPVDSIGIASPGVINCDKHNGKGIMRCRLLS